MLSFKLLGRYGRFGNQMFQYAFLRTAAQRLGTQFYCPAWLGDAVFRLDDAAERAPQPEGILKTFMQPRSACGYQPDAAFIKDHTEIIGWFQSARHFDEATVRSWYTFRDDVISSVRTRFASIDFSNAVGVHARFGDMIDHYGYINLSAGYYRKALRRLRPYGSVLVFSDDPKRAERLIRRVTSNFICIEANEPFEDLYLLSRCQSVVCSVSTFSWWGAWLRARPGKRVVAPREWIRPGVPVDYSGLSCPEWDNLRAARPIFDHNLWWRARKWAARQLSGTRHPP